MGHNPDPATWGLGIWQQGKGVSIKCYCSSAAKLRNLWGALQAGCYGSIGQRLSAPGLGICKQYTRKDSFFRFLFPNCNLFILILKIFFLKLL